MRITAPGIGATSEPASASDVGSGNRDLRRAVEPRALST